MGTKKTSALAHFTSMHSMEFHASEEASEEDWQVAFVNDSGCKAVPNVCSSALATSVQTQLRPVRCFVWPRTRCLGYNINRSLCISCNGNDGYLRPYIAQSRPKLDHSTGDLLILAASIDIRLSSGRNKSSNEVPESIAK